MASLPLSPPEPKTPAFAMLIAVSAALTAAVIILLVLRDWSLAAAFLSSGIILGGAGVAARSLRTRNADAVSTIDWSVARALADGSDAALAVTDNGGRLICANRAYEAMFGGLRTPPNLTDDAALVSQLGNVGRAAWRDGAAEAVLAMGEGRLVETRITRAGDDMLVWRFARAPRTAGEIDPLPLIANATGDRLAAAGIMVVATTADGRIESANSAFRLRAMGSTEATVEGADLARLLVLDERGIIRFEREGTRGTPLRLLQIPLSNAPDARIVIALLDEAEEPLPATIGSDVAAHVRALVSLLPFAMALVDRDGRFVHMNDAFRKAVGIKGNAPPLYPGDLVVREDKGALADHIRRFSGGAAHAAEIQVRLAGASDEPLTISLAGARGLGDAAVILGLKDHGEEGAQLKQHVAQASKMQAVGQLAGGVAHDFNNIITAIIGHCDLMLMRHSPGDSDYDDIQQVRINSNRAAALTRQLLAFSRQQTLRPQVLQLPDVISEVSQLLTRLLGETVRLEVKHGRGLGAVRADPGQLEQVVVNLAVNARDAMLAANPSGGGTLTIETLAISAVEMRAMDNELMPVGDYAALRVSDTGTGIPPEILPKIFDPFFSTKEVGKGTGLGLATVYGIVKQSGGFIFAESPPGKGAVFTIYLPVHAASAEPLPKPAPKRVPKTDIWGSETILLVEDEAMVRAVAERALARQGYKVLTAEHGEAALDLLEECGRPDLLISDVVMPIMDGPTMVRKVRERYPDLPILFMSGYAEEQLRRSIDIDNVAFLPKPFSVQQLAEAAREALVAE
ncbi:response regulator [Sphingomonas sp.]